MKIAQIKNEEKEEKNDNFIRRNSVNMKQFFLLWDNNTHREQICVLRWNYVMNFGVSLHTVYNYEKLNGLCPCLFW